MFKSPIDPQKLGVFLEINELLNSSYFDLNGLFTQILDSATSLTGGEASSLLLLQQETQRLEFVVALGPKGEAVKLFSVPKGEGIAGWVAEHNTSLHVPDVENEPRFYSKISQNVGFQTRSILAVPLRVKGVCVGVLEMINKRNGGFFTVEDMTWLELFANQAGLAIQNAKSFQAMRDELNTLKNTFGSKLKPPGLLFQSSEMASVLDLCRKYASTDSTVLIQGENGVGKELVADFLHQHGGRAGNALVKINCAALPESLLESELFGHAKGAFTDAVSDKVGRFEQAQGGTLFLDEIGAMPLSVQSKLLRALQFKLIEPLGGGSPVSLDVRLVVATNEPLEKAVAEGRFRQDLYYRLNVLPLFVPPLRARVADIAFLARIFLQEACVRLGKGVKDFHPVALDRLKSHSWPGNVRELQNTVERAVVLSRGGLVLVEDLGLPTRVENSVTDLKTATQHFRATLIERVLAENQGNQTKAAKVLGIQRTYLSKLLKELNIEANEKGVLHGRNE